MDREIVRKFVKETNLHCFPIFPRFNPASRWRHPFAIDGWEYYQDCRNVVLKELEIPMHDTETAQESSSDI